MEEKKLKMVVPAPAIYKGEAPKQVALMARQDRLLSSRRGNLAKLKELETAHYTISGELETDLRSMHDQSKEADELQLKAQESGMMASLMRRFNRRSLMLQRRSVTELLVQKHAAVTRCQSRASVFADELQLVAFGLRDQIERVYSQLEQDRANVRISAHRVLELEKQLARLEGEHGLEPRLVDRYRDQLEFEERAESGRLVLLRASLNMGLEELSPMRALRDTAQEMHQEMSELVQKVGGAVRLAGRQIEVLGMAADAPMVVAELHESMEDLDRAMVATERYIEHARRLFTETVPEFTRQLEQASSRA